VLLPQLRTLLNLPQVTSPAPSAPTPAAKSPRLVELTAKYRLHLQAVLVQLPALVAECHTVPGERALRDALHQLAGTAGSYGFATITEAALNLRGALMAKQPLEPAVDQLRRALAAAAA
jgi:hypothetical protein